MPKTFVKDSMRVIAFGDPVLGYIEDELPEKATQTFKAVAPIVYSSGYAAEAASTLTGSVAAWAVADGSNAASDGLVKTKIIWALSNVRLEVTALGAAAADYVLAATDLGATHDLTKSATLVGGATAGWYVDMSATAQNVVRVQSFRNQYIWTNQTDANRDALVGDTNVRLTVMLVPGKSLWY